jgi:uncharacterized Zn finger protein
MSRRRRDLMSLLPGFREKWIAVLRGFRWPVPAPKGKTARLAIGSDGLTGSIRTGGVPEHVRIRLVPLPERTFEAAMRRLSGRAASAATLLAGRLPEDADAAFTTMRYGLLPRRPEEVVQTCSCGSAPPCSHLLAAHAALAARLATDPMLLLELRGRSRDEILAAVRRHRAVAAPARSEVAAGGAAPRDEARAPLPDEVWERPEGFFKPLLPPGALAVAVPSGESPDTVLAVLGAPPLSDPDAARLVVDFHRAIGLGAAERLAEWEWRRAGKS